MYCRKCGAEQPESARYCGNCGYNLYPDANAQSGAAVSWHLGYAGFWRRFGAYILDWIIMVILSLGISAVTRLGFNSPDTDPVAYIFSINYLLYAVVSIAANVLYWGLFESSPLQATPGKLALGIKVTDMEGNRVSFGRAAGRYFGKILSSLILCIGYLMIAFTEKKQALHDIMAGTLVVKK
jgi:uncharacterized RDD family membrane protein YckC